MNTILKYNPGVSREEMTQSLQEYADANGESLTAVVEQNAADLKAYATTHDASSLGQGGISPQSSGGDGTSPLPNAKVQGDIFWKASGFWNHVGLYYHIDKVAQAPGFGKQTEIVYASSVTVGNYGRYSIAVPRDIRTTAANWTGRRIGRPYSFNFTSNKVIESPKYNCSQYVWAAYKASGYDLAPKGSHVWPDDIIKSSLLKHY